MHLDLHRCRHISLCHKEGNCAPPWLTPAMVDGSPSLESKTSESQTTAVSSFPAQPLRKTRLYELGEASAQDVKGRADGNGSLEEQPYVTSVTREDVSHLPPTFEPPVSPNHLSPTNHFKSLGSLGEVFSFPY